MKRLTILALATWSGLTLVSAGQTVVGKNQIEEVHENLCDTLFDLPTIYSDKENPVLQKFAFIGRYHGQYYFLDSNQGNADDWDHRRAHFGAEAQIFHAVKLQLQFNLNLDGGGRFLRDLEDVSAQFAISKDFKLTVGKQKAPITNEWRTSSNRIVTFERSRIIGQAVPDKMGGILASYAKDNFLFDLGAYTNTVDEDWAYPTFDGGFSLFASVGYKTEGVGTTRLEYLFSDIDHDAAASRPRGFEHVFSINHSGQWDKFGLVIDTLYAIGDENVSDVYGLSIIPTYDLTDKLKLVARYQVAASDSEDGFALQSRYEREAPDLVTSRGDFYQAIYAGLNYSLCGDNLKLMTGVEYTDFDQTGGSSYEAWTVFGGVRLSF